MMQSITPVLRVEDYQRAKRFYINNLGFSCVQEAGEPVTGFGIFVRDSIRVFLIAWDGAAATYENWRAWVYVSDMDGLLGDLANRGTELSKEPNETFYDMREFEVTDPDGNVLCFGTDA